MSTFICGHKLETGENLILMLMITFIPVNGLQLYHTSYSVWSAILPTADFIA